MSSVPVAMRRRPSPGRRSPRARTVRRTDRPRPRRHGHPGRRPARHVTRRRPPQARTVRPHTARTEVGGAHGGQRGHGRRGADGQHRPAVAHQLAVVQLAQAVVVEDVGAGQRDDGASAEVAGDGVGVNVRGEHVHRVARRTQVARPEEAHTNHIDFHCQPPFVSVRL